MSVCLCVCVLKSACVFICVLATHNIASACQHVSVCLPALTQVCRTYPKVKILTSEIDQEVDANFVVVPGVGQFGDRCDA